MSVSGPARSPDQGGLEELDVLLLADLSIRFLLGKHIQRMGGFTAVTLHEVQML